MNYKTLLLQNSFRIIDAIQQSQKNFIIILSVFASIGLFDFLFYESLGLGLNGLIMLLITVPLLFIVHHPPPTNRMIWMSIFIAILASFNMVFNLTAYTVTFYFLSIFFMIGAFQSKSAKNFFSLFVQYLLCQILVPFNWIHFFLAKENWKSEHRLELVKKLRIVSIPMLLIIVFVIIYGNASAEFHQFIIVRFQSLLDHMETQINIERIFFWIVSCILISSSLLPIQFSKLRFDDSQYFEEIARKKAQSKEKKKFGMTALNKELSIAVLTMGSLNIVILILNILDIRYVWLDYSSKTAAQLSQFVHAGTTNLIFAIILGIGVLLVFFRKNLNFHPMASLLRKLSYMWLIQNAFLALSTLIRNLHYVHSYGLTHKRLGVAVFTVIVGIGLFVVYQKIKYKQSLYHSFSKHSLATVFCLLIFGAINQEKLIILTSVYFQKENIDKRYLLSISDESDYLLYQYADQINAKINPTYPIDKEALLNDEYYYGMEWKNWNFNEWYNQYQLQKFRKAEGIE